MIHLAYLGWLSIPAAAPLLHVAEATVLSLLFTGLLLYLGVRERYLIIWLGGWAFFLLSRQATIAAVADGIHEHFLWANLCFVLAVALFTVSALYYSDSRRYLPWIGVLCPFALGAAVVQAIWLPSSVPLSICFQILYHAMAVLAAMRLIRFVLGRPEIGSWLFALALLLLHSDAHPGGQMADAFEFSSAGLLRISILLVVLDESWVRARRLNVMNAIAGVAVGDRDHNGVMLTSMRELCRLNGAKFAWFQMVESDELVLKQYVGLPEWITEHRRTVPLRTSVILPLLNGREARTVSVRSLAPELRDDLQRAGMRFLLLVPVVGDTAFVGILAFGLTGRRSFTAGQLRFLTTAGNQLVDVAEKKRLEHETRRHNRDLAALNAMATITATTFDLDEILQNTLRWTTELFAQQCDILLFDPESGNVMRSETNRPNREEERAELRALVQEKLAGYIARVQSEIFTEQDLPRLPEAARSWIAKQGTESFVAVMMYSQRRTMGILLISSRNRNQFTANDHNLAIAIARQLGSSVEKVLIYEEMALAYENLRNAQEQLLQSEKMSAVGQLISGVAHELNNPLAAILGYVQLLETEPIEERAQGYVRKLYQQTQRTHRVVQNLLSFSRQRKPMQTKVDLRCLVEDTLALREFDLKLNHVTVERDYDPDVPFITGDANQLEQVFLNIINNAVDAIMDSAQGGTLRVRMYAENSRACVEFRDSGTGLKDLSKIYDPFYTTKKIGKGSGLGLSICYGLVKEHGGDIVAFNHSQGGAVFQIKLPIAGPQISCKQAKAGGNSALSETGL